MDIVDEDCCQHIEDYKRDDINTFRVVHAIFVVCTDEKSKQTKLKNAFCHVCQRLGPHLHACLHCVFFGCHKHIREHTADMKHCFSMDLTYGQVHCTKCDDYIYDSKLDEIAMTNKMSAAKCNKRLLNWTSWEPLEEDRGDFLNCNPKRICITPDSTIGLRGLLNLGSTCFMNCIVQALMHTPLLRDYFLSERHKCNGLPGTCLVCELSRLFQEFYRGQRVPLALNKLLHLIWTHAQQLAGYEQQDAHEFFIETLGVLHKHCEELSPQHSTISTTEKITKCASIIDQIFAGGLQSDLVCQKCNAVSTTIDPTWDFSLDLGPVSLGGRPPSSLIDCLERYTRPEHLGSIKCSSCQSYQESTKQLTLKTLPIVVSFHLKRFQHSKEVRFLPTKSSLNVFFFIQKEKKILTSISFPEMLDMTPFMSRNKTSSSYPIPPDNRYSLFAVINHLGSSINAGHYTAYVRQQRDYWYKCDDHVITRANLKEVLDSEGYLLFYHKHNLGYE
ncbi:PREDICTED: LOW QUALITY PROTEIN: ubiquitin carboxyl-terminal hydrolase nonstop [Nicrophorus vespilloides]|uniref:Ubiquitin carboxyl-terminal hydrolase n=1 Tax=Nicrophorus vespilloides TaxID=110193 RepID=A0ABM1N5J8_NICVS|nr:PREDICTED: LOW QUALITY PROTEIN: ubiquitin carboxyl-terminal hydrolase nonstop [Nicrophorus vespilloides]